MLVELSTDVTDKIFTICNEWGIDTTAIFREEKLKLIGL